MADVSQIKLPNGSVYDLIDEKSGYITAEYIENKTDYEIPVSRVGEIVVGETAIGTDSTNFPTSKAVVDYVDERVVQEIDAIDVGVTGIKANGTSLAIENGVVNIPVVSLSQPVGLMTSEYMEEIYNSIPTSTSQLTNDSGYVVGLSSSVNNHVATFYGTTGNTIQDSGYTIAKSVPSSAVFTDQRVESQVISASSSSKGNYPILLHTKAKLSDVYTDSAYKMATFYFHYGYTGSDVPYLKVQNATLASEYLSLSKNSGIIYSTRIQIDSALNSSITLTLPKETGTLALTSDIPTVPTNISSFTNDSGYLTASDIASVMTYKGTKANYAALPASGNTTGDVWHLTDTGAEWAWDGSAWQELGTAIDLSNYATKATTLAGYGITDAKIENGTITLGGNTITPLTSFTETDPTVPSWAKASTKPSYGLTEISGTDDLRAIEALTGTSGLLKKTAANTWTLDTNAYLTSYTETDPTVPSWAKASTKPTYTAAEVGALPDTTTIPSKTSDLTNDSGFITGYTETDPVFSASAAAGITSADISNWNSKTSNTGTVTSVTVSNATNGGLSVSGSPVTSSGTITIGHSNVLTSAQSTQAVYPIAIDKNGHISSYGTAVTIPQVYSSTNTGGYLTMATLPIYDGTVV